MHKKENDESVAKQIADLTEVIETGLSRAELQTIISPGAARNDVGGNDRCCGGRSKELTACEIDHSGGSGSGRLP